MNKHPTDTVVDLTQNDPSRLVQTARNRYNEGRTRPIKFRKKQLQGIVRFLEENEEAILDALYKDLRKPKQEGVAYEILPVVKEAKHALHHLEGWSKPEKPSKAFVNLMDGVLVYNDPYGVVLVMGAWNYPLQVTLSPVVGAIAAGNCVVIKPSDLSPFTSQIIHDKLPNYIDYECYPVYLGGVKESTELLKEKFDYIFFTGSTTVGRIIHQAANKHLTPVTLELGGKSPAYIDTTADISKTVRRILWGKCMNAGQTCIAPDYVLCNKQVQEKFVKYAQKVVLEFFGQDVKESPDFSRIVTKRHFDRLTGLLAGLKIALGGRYESKDRFIEPTIVVDVNPQHAIMQEEIFGPILPIITVKNVDEAIGFINQREKPLALYIFSNNKNEYERILNNTSSGGACINDTILHAACENLPFGGVGHSGMGSYHGKKSFDTFTHKKSVLIKDFKALPEKVLSSRYPPYSDSKLAIILAAMKERKKVSLKYLPHASMFLLGVTLTIGVYYLYITFYK